ncbi:hypothetical protein EJB05_34680, partial [Eragrostis curvula]
MRVERHRKIPKSKDASTRRQALSADCTSTPLPFTYGCFAAATVFAIISSAAATVFAVIFLQPQPQLQRNEQAEECADSADSGLNCTEQIAKEERGLGIRHRSACTVEGSSIFDSRLQKWSPSTIPERTWLQCTEDK